jgi:uncharacterized protein YegL
MPVPKKTTKKIVKKTVGSKPVKKVAKKAIQPLIIAAVIDKSGSMMGTAVEVIGGFNRFLDEQKAIPGQVDLMVTMFDTKINTDTVDLQKAKHLTSETYQPGGGTALYDAIGLTVKALKEHKNFSKSRVMVLVMTDGEENSSQEYNSQNVTTLIAEGKALGWDFVFLGANQEIIQQGARVGMSTGIYTASAAGTTAMYSNLSSNVSLTRSAMAAGSAKSVTLDSLNWTTGEQEDPDKK